MRDVGGQGCGSLSVWEPHEEPAVWEPHAAGEGSLAVEPHEEPPPRAALTGLGHEPPAGHDHTQDAVGVAAKVQETGVGARVPPGDVLLKLLLAVRSRLLVAPRVGGFQVVIVDVLELPAGAHAPVYQHLAPLRHGCARGGRQAECTGDNMGPGWAQGQPRPSAYFEPFSARMFSTDVQHARQQTMCKG